MWPSQNYRAGCRVEEAQQEQKYPLNLALAQADTYGGKRIVLVESVQFQNKPSLANLGAPAPVEHLL